MTKLLKVLREELLNKEYGVIELSNKLIAIDKEIEDICEFGNWEEILESEVVVVAAGEFGENHIAIDFEVVFKNGDDEVPEASIIKIIDIYNH